MKYCDVWLTPLVSDTQVEEESSEDSVAAASNILDVTQDIGRSVASTLGRYCIDIFSSLGRCCVDILLYW